MVRRVVDPAGWVILGPAGWPANAGWFVLGSQP